MTEIDPRLWGLQLDDSERACVTGPPKVARAKANQRALNMAIRRAEVTGASVVRLPAGHVTLASADAPDDAVPIAWLDIGAP